MLFGPACCVHAVAPMRRWKNILMRAPPLRIHQERQVDGVTDLINIALCKWRKATQGWTDGRTNEANCNDLAGSSHYQFRRRLALRTIRRGIDERTSPITQKRARLCRWIDSQLPIYCAAPCRLYVDCTAPRQSVASARTIVAVGLRAVGKLCFISHCFVLMVC